MNEYSCTANWSNERCKDGAIYLVWFADLFLYAYLCMEHTVQAMRNDIDGHRVVCIRTIEEATKCQQLQS